jgi:hypothetical protein
MLRGDRPAPIDGRIGIGRTGEPFGTARGAAQQQQILADPRFERNVEATQLSMGPNLVDCPILIGPNGPCASLPSNPQVDKDSHQKTDANGKRAFEPVLEWRDRGLGDRSSAAVVVLVRQSHPDALDAGVP